MKRIVKINLCILILILFLFTSFGFGIVYAEEEFVEEVTEEEIGIIEKEALTDMDVLNIEKTEREESIDSSIAQIGIIQEELSSTVAEMATLNQSIYDKQLEIEQSKIRQRNILNLIADLEEKIEESNKRYESQKNLLERRLVAMYEIGDASYLEFLLSSKSISDFLSNYYMVSEEISTDNE